MAERTYQATLEREYAAPRLTVWGVVSDTNRWDRASGLTPGRYEWREHQGRRVRSASARELGFEIEWIEPPYEWIEGRFVRGERIFQKGPVARGGFEARLEDAGPGRTRVKAVAYVAGEGPLLHLVGPVMKGKFGKALREYLGGLEDMLGAAAGAPVPDVLEGQSAALVARDALARHAYDALTQGPRSPVSRTELGRRAARLSESGLDAPLVRRLTEALAERPDEEIAQMRPFELADRWHVDRRELLRVFLHATRAGLVDLRWQINCPVCRVAAQVVGALADVTGKVHCVACNIGYGVDFGQHVEAVFQCHPSIRAVETSVFCASSPSFLPHVVAQLSVDSGGSRTELSDLRPGAYHFRLLSRPETAELRLEEPSSIRLSIGPAELHAVPATPVDGSSLVLESTADAPEVVLVERSGADSGAVLGSVIASFPDFLDLFATEAPAAGIELSIAHLAVLFSDLTGSTALYGRIGDARAFAVVQEHFRDMEAIVAAHEGAVVKTMGDAVMATFTSEKHAVAAATQMLKRCREKHGELGLGAKLGVCAGPCLAVRANERLDFFGTTVNLAARLQARAEGGQLVVTRELSTDPEVKALLSPFPQRPFQAALKGIATPQDLVAVDVVR